MSVTRILVVDDEPSVTALLPRVLATRGYETMTANTVAEALNLITSQNFDVLISDLNMGHIADGFTVVHTMRRVNPACINFILTGYPAFESALQALRAQVDDYLTKPSDIPKLLDAIDRKLKQRAPVVRQPMQRLSTILRDNEDKIKERVLLNMKADPEVAALPLSDEERIGHLPAKLRELADHLDCGLPNEANEMLFRAAQTQGELRAQQHYPLELMIRCDRIVSQVISNIICEELLVLNLSYLLLDMNKLNDARLMQLEIAVSAYRQAERRRA